jgi:hypothetical protein
MSAARSKHCWTAFRNAISAACIRLSCATPKVCRARAAAQPLGPVIGHRPTLLRFPIMRELVLSRVLFHELGHHIHLALEPVYADKEEIADYWQAALGRQFFRGRYWYAYPFFYLVHYGELLMQRLRRRP